MRVLLTTDTIGGVWTFTSELTAELLRNGHAVALVSFGRLPSASQTSWCDATRAAYGDFFRYIPSSVPLEWMASNENAYAAAEPVLLQVADQFLPDILHSNQFCFGRLPLSVPKVITAHSDVLSWATACRSEALEPSLWLNRYRSLVREGLEAADAVVAPTQWMLGALHKNFTISSSAYVVLNGRTLPLSVSSETPSLQAVSVGRLWDEAKNIALLTRIVPPFPIFIAGEQQYEKVRSSSDFGNLKSIGYLTEDALLRLFRQSSIYLVPSLYEPFGLAPLEAALCGCAVVANDIPSLREVWGDGALYFSGPANLTDLLHSLKDSPEMLQRSRQQSRQRAMELTSSRMTSSYLDIYEKLPPPKPHASLEKFAHA